MPDRLVPWEEAREAVLAVGRAASCFQILNPGIRRWRAPAGAVVGYVAAGRFLVAAGEPVSDPAGLAAAISSFEAATERPVLWFGVERPFLRARPVEAGRRALLGRQPVWDPSRWGEVVAGKASLRAQFRRARNKGVEAASWDAGRADREPRLRRCLEEWVVGRRLPPLHFLVEPDTLGRLGHRRLWVATRRGEPIAFLVASPIPARRGWLVEQIVRGRGAVNGTAELLVDAAMRGLAAEGAAIVTLGLSPLSRRGTPVETAGPRWLRALFRATRSLGRPFYDFVGLDAFKAKFRPHAWEPVFAVTSRERFGIGELLAIARAFAAEPLRTFVPRAAGRAAAGAPSRWWRRKGLR